MNEHSAAVAAFLVAAVLLVLAFILGGLHLWPSTTSPLSGTATAGVSTALIVLASVFLVWGLLHLGFATAR